MVPKGRNKSLRLPWHMSKEVVILETWNKNYMKIILVSHCREPCLRSFDEIRRFTFAE